MTETESERNEGRSPGGRPSLSVARVTLLGLFLVALAYGLVVGDDYGSSTDEPANARVGKDALKAFRDRRGFSDYLEHKEVLAHHGPSYFMVYSAASRTFDRVIPRWQEEDGRHFTNYLSHLLGAVCFYYLARRLMEWPYAALATVFFATQPMLLGHAFINQKDTPFMAFLMASVVSGLIAVDRLVVSDEAERGHGRGGTFLATVGEEWRARARQDRWLGLLLLTFTIVAATDVLFLESAVGWFKGVVSQAYSGQAWTPINWAFQRVAEDAQTASLDDYLYRIRWLYWRSRMATFGLSLLPALLAAIWLLPRSVRLIWRRYRWPALWVLLAGGLLGFTISIRPVGGLAGLLVSLYWLRKLKLGSWGLLPLYWLFSGVVMYTTWPYLWPAPLQRAIESVAFTGGFDKATLYLGQVVFSKSLPWHYFPVLATLELTEPTMLLFLLGTFVTVSTWLQARRETDLLLVLLFWSAVPLFGLLVFKLSVYGNLRHLLFVLVPMLLMAGIGIRWLLRRLPNPWLKGIAATALLVPSLIGILRIHPYEYGYFNAFSGGIERASHNFLLDRWCTSYREAMIYVNERAYPNAIISPLYTDEVAAPFARPDLKISIRDVDALPNAAYHLTCAFFIGGEGYKDPGEWYRVHTVERSGAVLAEVYRQLSVPPWYP